MTEQRKIKNSVLVRLKSDFENQKILKFLKNFDIKLVKNTSITSWNQLFSFN